MLAWSASCFVPGPTLHGKELRVSKQTGVEAGFASVVFLPSVPQASAAAEPFQFIGKTSAELFPLSNVSLLTWILLLVFPSWQYTKYAALAAPVINALLYAATLTYLLTHPAEDAPAIDFSSLSGIVTAFRNPDGVLAGWLHYCCFDPLVGLGEVLDSQEQKVPHIFVVPCLLLTLLFGPVGFLSYITVRTVIVATREEQAA